MLPQDRKEVSIHAAGEHVRECDKYHVVEKEAICPGRPRTLRVLS